MKIVLDANIFISALIVENGTQYKIVHHKKRYAVVISEEILQEVEEVLHYDRIQKKYNVSNQEIRSYLHQLRRDCVIRVYPAVKVVDEDPDDNKYIACAKQVKADYIVTGDRHLLDLKEYRGIRIVTPTEFLRILELS
jgi:uncharacterized protein